MKKNIFEVSVCENFKNNFFQTIFLKTIKMDSIAIFFEEDEESVSVQDVKRFRQNIRNSSNICCLPDTEFIRNFRLTKEAFKYVLGEIKNNLKMRCRTSAVSAELKLAATLRFLAEGSYQRGTGNDFNLGLAQSTMSGVLEEVLECLQDIICPKWVCMNMTREEKAEAKQYFFEKSGFPGVIGCVDGTHIRILTPCKNQQHLYYNRKGFSSLNAMIACDHKMRIRFIDARHPGASHDALIWNISELRHFMETNFISGDRSTWLLGDAGYPLEPFLMTPFRAAAENSPESKYNSVHSKARNVVERTIGVLKNRFRCLLSARQLHYSPAKATKIVNICAALHNICLYYYAPDVAEIQLGESEPIFSSVDDSTRSNSNTVAVDIRTQIKNAIHV